MAHKREEDPDGTDYDYIRGQDHRPPVIICKQEEKIHNISDTIIRVEGKVEKLDLRINGSLEKIGEHIADGSWYRKLIITTAISLVLSVIGGIFTAAMIAYRLGQYTNQIAINTGRLTNLESKIHESTISMEKRSDTMEKREDARDLRESR
jgi:hypothetical protein